MKYFKNKKGKIFIAVDRKNFYYLSSSADNYEDYSNSEIKKLFNGSDHVSSMSFAAINEYPFLLHLLVSLSVNNEYYRSKNNLLKELKTFDTRIRKALNKYSEEIKRFNKRVILVNSEDGSAWDDILFIIINDSKFDIYTSVYTMDNSYQELIEIVVGEFESNRSNSFKYLPNRETIVNSKLGLEFSAESLYSAIYEVIKDDYGKWEDIKWTWDSIINNLENNNKTYFLVEDLKNHLNEKRDYK